MKRVKLALSTTYIQACMIQAREVEPALWKSVYYRPIEEFRRRIKAAAAAGERGREPLQKVHFMQLFEYPKVCGLPLSFVWENVSNNGSYLHRSR